MGCLGHVGIIEVPINIIDIDNILNENNFDLDETLRDFYEKNTNQYL